MDLIITVDGWLKAGDKKYRAAFGKNGIGPKTREGDGISPKGTWPLREVYYRPDRMPQPTTGLPLHAMTPGDAWCDVPGDPKYNQFVKLPYAVKDEKLWRDDHLYDVIVVIGYNDAPVIDGKGSAIFFHLARENYAPTSGCAAVSMSDMLEILPKLREGSTLSFYQCI
jgi:L,D-peptidoglycan transpeptidase YkuD (ErfK/YbiS/YcfS/YnhG family)